MKHTSPAADMNFQDVAILDKVDQVIASGLRLPRWGWPVPCGYNGATGEERILGWQKLVIACKQGWTEFPSACSICRREGKVHQHTENYFRPLYVKAVCQSCHFRLHRRFVAPESWIALLSKKDLSPDWAMYLTKVELTRRRALVLAQQADPTRVLAAY